MLVLLGFVFSMILRRDFLSLASENLLYITSIYTFYVGTIENHGLYHEFSPNHSATYYIEFQCRFMTKITQPIYVSFDYVIYHTHKIKLASANWTGLNPIMDIELIINAVLDFLLRIHSEIYIVLNKLEWSKYPFFLFLAYYLIIETRIYPHFARNWILNTRYINEKQNYL